MIPMLTKRRISIAVCTVTPTTPTPITMAHAPVATASGSGVSLSTLGSETAAGIIVTSDKTLSEYIADNIQ